MFKRVSVRFLRCVVVVASLAGAWPVSAGVVDEPAPVVWLERLEKASDGGLPLLKAIPAGDPRVADAGRLIDNEAATFTRTLVAWAWKAFGAPPTWPDGHLPILLQPGGNNASVGFRLQEDGRVTEHADVPYIILGR